MSTTINQPEASRAMRDGDVLPTPDGECRACHAPVRWAVTSKGRRMPIDANTNEHGNIVLERLPEPHPATRAMFRALVVTEQDHLAAGVLRYRSHFATCPEAARFRRASR